MKKLAIGDSGLFGSEIALGCMQFSKLDYKTAERLTLTAVETGVDFFDHADIYGGGASEEMFGRVLAAHPSLREKIKVQSKCGIRPGRYDFSKGHILSAVEGSLKRLNADYLDALLLHRPDTLVEPEQVAEAFEILHASGKVRHFGVSNHSPMQIELLKTAVSLPLVANQLQFSLAHTGMVDAGINVNTKSPAGLVRDGAILEYSRINKMTIQAWSPFQFGLFEGFYLDNPDFPELNAAVDKCASEFGVVNSAVVLAWILRHPAKIQALVGTTKPERLESMAKAADIEMSGDVWYELYRAAGNKIP